MVDVHKIVRERRAVGRPQPSPKPFLRPLRGAVRNLHGYPAAGAKKAAKPGEHVERPRNVLEHVGQRDRVVASRRLEPIDISLMNHRASRTRDQTDERRAEVVEGVEARAAV